MSSEVPVNKQATCVSGARESERELQGVDDGPTGPTEPGFCLHDPCLSFLVSSHVGRVQKEPNCILAQRKATRDERSRSDGGIDGCNGGGRLTAPACLNVDGRLGWRKGLRGGQKWWG